MAARVSLSFAKFSDTELENFAHGVIARMTGNATYPTSGKLVASVSPVKNINMYEGRIKGPAGDWLPSVFTGDSQHIIFDSLTPGTMYTAQVCSLGGSTGQSDWSDPSSHMAM